MSGGGTRADGIPQELVCPFDYHRPPPPGVSPFEVLDELRGRPIHWSDARRGCWVLTRLEDIRYVFQHPDLFSTYPLMDVEGGGGWPRKLIPMELDPPEHGIYRHPISTWFSPRAAVAMEEEIRALVGSLVDRVASAGRCEFQDDFAKPFPTTIFVRMLGLPAEEADHFVRWNTDLLHSQDGGKRHAAGGQIHQYLSQVISERRRAPADDIISVLLGSEVGGRLMNVDEVLDTCFLLFMAGLDTVTASLGFMVKFLAENPEHRRQLVEDPSIAPAAVEELVRVHAVVNPTRTVIQDTELCGVQLRKGQRVLLSTALATRDPEAYGDAMTVRFDRKPNNHIAFGAGPHRCLGSHLARKELQIALVEWHRRIPDYRVAAEPTIKAHAGGVLGIDVLPLEWDISDEAVGVIDTPVLFDDLHVGLRLTTTQTYEMTADEIVEFAARFDPQPFHLDEEAAATTDFGGLVASGLHTFAASCRLGHSERPLTATIAGLGIDELRMLHPVRPGDRLSQTTELVELRASRSHPDRGVVRARREVVNQDQVPVLRCTVAWLVKRGTAA